MRVPSPYAPSAGIVSCSRIMFLLQIVQTIEPKASPSAFRKRLKRITRPQHTGIQTFWELSALIGRFPPSKYRKYIPELRCSANCSARHALNRAVPELSSGFVVGHDLARSPQLVLVGGEAFQAHGAARVQL